jgi:TatD DNase family protein
VGVHPTRCSEFEEHPEGAEAYMAALLDIILEGQHLGKVVAVGEMGLDYDRCLLLLVWDLSVLP